MTTEELAEPPEAVGKMDVVAGLLLGMDHVFPDEPHGIVSGL